MATQVNNSPLRVGYDSLITTFNGLKNDLKSNFFKTAIKITALVLSLCIFAALAEVSGVGLLTGSLGSVGGALAVGSIEGLACILSFFPTFKIIKDGFLKFDKLNKVYIEKAAEFNSKFFNCIGETSIEFRYFHPILNIDSFEKVQERYVNNTNFVDRAFQRVFA